MLSLGNAFAPEEVEEFVARIRRFLKLADTAPLQFTAEPKIDGLSISLRYEAGRLIEAATRGDGYEGENVTRNVETIRDIPRRVKAADMPAVFEVRGEIYMTHKDFAALKTVSTGSWLKQSVHGQGLGKEMRAAVTLYAFDWLKAEVAESEAAAWNAASLGVSRALGYELNGVTRTAWGNKVEEVQKVRLTPQTFKRPDWTLQVEGHEPAARFLGA